MTAGGYVHADGGELRDGNGNPIVMRGVGLGNWMLPEGYMWKLDPPGPQSPRKIEALIVDLVGQRRADMFWQRFRAEFITERDIIRIAAEGFDHVRLPLNARLLITDDGELKPAGFALIDRLVEWCRTHGLWVILDLHGAPGGQTGTNIDDSPNEIPELFDDPHYRELTVLLWTALAQRYRHDPTVAGYDLLNEPLPDGYQELFRDELVGLYVELTRAIRAVDPHHLLIYEGMHWATNWSIFDTVWDPNSMLQFHKYWSPPDQSSIQRFIEIGKELGLPIYMGEGGENNTDWIQTAFQLYDDHRISWNFWPWKKIDTLTSPCSVIAPPGWRDICAYASGHRRKPDTNTAWDTLTSLLDAFDIEQSEWRADVVSAMFHRIPLRIPASGFGFRGEGTSYRVADPRPLAQFRSTDAVTLRTASDDASPQLRFDHTSGQPRDRDDEVFVDLEERDWVEYIFQAPAAVGVDIRVSIDASTSDELPLDIIISGSPARVTWPDVHTILATGPALVGENTVRLIGRTRRVHVRYLSVSPT